MDYKIRVETKINKIYLEGSENFNRIRKYAKNSMVHFLVEKIIEKYFKNIEVQRYDFCEKLRLHLYVFNDEEIKDFCQNLWKETKKEYPSNVQEVLFDAGGTIYDGCYVDGNFFDAGGGVHFPFRWMPKKNICKW